MKNILHLMKTHIPGMLTCQQVDHFLFQYYEKQLPFKKKLFFNLHLMICPKCRRYIKHYKHSVALAKSCQLSADKIPVPDDLVQTILKAQTKKKQ